MGFVKENYRALKHLINPPPSVENQSPEQLTNRAEHAILDANETKSDDSLSNEKIKASAEQDPGGMDCTVRNLYKDRKGNWTDKYPHWIDEPAESTTTSRSALIVHNQRSMDGRKKFRIESFTVQSPLLKQALGNIFADYPGVTTDVARLEFKTPFAPFVHRWHAFEQATVNEKHTETKQHLALLWNILETELRDLLQKMKDHERHNVTDFDSMWTLFEPGSYVYHEHDESERVFQCMSCTTTDSGYELQLRYIDWDGEDFGSVTMSINVASFAGTRSLQDLIAIPMERHPDKSNIQSRLKARGRHFESLKGYQFRAYEGVGLDTSSCSRFNIDSRVIIDTSAFNMMNKKGQVLLQKKVTTNRLQANDLLIARDTVRAYSLRDKKWFHCFVNAIAPITFSAQAFESLVLPPASKSLVHAFGTAQLKTAAAQAASNELIQGKGQGTVMLLSGPPGVGKTLTAESMAEDMHVPLFMLSAGDLGTEPAAVEAALVQALNLCAKWNAVLLLDEADVFLRSRSVGDADLERNKLVSIFLRVLEYHKGFLVLTTNRLDDLDAAFESRIHLALRYKDLDEGARRTVWKGSLKASVEDITDVEMRELTRPMLNGRQIKNCVRSAKMLASSRGDSLKMGDLRAVLKVRDENAADD